MPREFIGGGRKQYHARDEYDRKKQGGANFFIWTILIVLLLAMNAGVWTFSMIVFGYPEKPFNYRLLTKLEKLEPIKRFPTLSAPKGKFHSAQQLYETFYAHTPQHLSAVNSLLLRNYIRNYKEAPPVIYTRGSFRIYQVRELGENDFFTSGVVIRALNQEDPQVEIEFVMPAKDVPAEHFAVGDDLDIDVEDSSSFAALLHVEKLPRYKICFTLVPIVYGKYPVKDGKSFSLSPPKSINISASLPVTDQSIGDLSTDKVAETP